jgi:preprotein translocase subunit SecE
MNALMNYFRDSVSELHQIRWPTQRQAVRLTVITIVFIIVTSLFFGVMDAGLTQIIRSTL